MRHIRIPSHTRAAVIVAIQDGLHELKHTNMRRYGPNAVRIATQIKLLTEALEAIENSPEFQDATAETCVTCCRPMD